MKNIRLLTFLLAISLFGSSCSQFSSITFTKRHYRKGYFIDITKAKAVNSNPLLVTAKDDKASLIASNSIITSKDIVIPVPSPTILVLSEHPKNITAVKKKKYSAPVAIAANCKVFSQNTSSKVINEDDNTTGNMNKADDRNDAGVAFVVIVICTIFIPPLGVGLKFGVDYHFWIDLLLTLLFFIPGLIYGLVVVLT